jgi:hypothetical protein
MGRQSRRKRGRSGPGDGDVVVTVMPQAEGLDLVGVVIRLGRDVAILAPDEARAFAGEVEARGGRGGPVMAARLRECAGQVAPFVAMANAQAGHDICRVIEARELPRPAAMGIVPEDN